MSGSAEIALVGLILVVVVATAVALVISGRRREAKIVVGGEASRAMGLGMAVGMLLGGLLGVIVWIGTGEFVNYVIFVGGGLAMGVAIGTAWANRQD
jgi:hypothetical protein